MLDNEIVGIIDEELYKAHELGDDIRLRVKNGAMFDSVYATVLIKHRVRISRLGYEFLIKKRFSVFLVRIRNEKIDSLLAN